MKILELLELIHERYLLESFKQAAVVFGKDEDRYNLMVTYFERDGSGKLKERNN